MEQGEIAMLALQVFGYLEHKANDAPRLADEYLEIFDKLNTKFSNNETSADGGTF